MSLRRYVPDSPGVSRPGWMDDEEWSEYRMTAEYAYEVSHVPDEPFDPDPFDEDFADFQAEQTQEHLDELESEAEEIPLHELEAAAEIINEALRRRKEEEG